jgi:hypothetical protein
MPPYAQGPNMVTHHTTFIGAVNALYNSILVRTGEYHCFDLTYFYGLEAADLVCIAAGREIHEHPMFKANGLDAMQVQYVSSLGLGGEVDGGCIVAYDIDTDGMFNNYFVVYAI